MNCPSDCTRHAHDPDSVVRHIVRRCEDGEGGQPRALSVQCSFGEPGSGKSDFNLYLGNLVQYELTGHYIAPQDLKHQLRFKPKNFSPMAIQAGKHKSVFCDEGSGEGANRLQPMKTENVEVGMDLDRCRLRGQPVWWANPTLNRLAPTVAEHATWMFDHGLGFSLQAWEIQAPNAIWGKNAFKHDRFKLNRKPSLASAFPELNKEYYTLKAIADVHGDVTQQSQRERDSDRLRLVIRRVLKVYGQSPDVAD
jgi:hypothetical protein